MLKTLNVSYSPMSGFRTEPFTFQAGLISGTFSLTPDRRVEPFMPRAYEVGEAKIEVLDMLVLKWATIVALRVSHTDRAYRVKTTWVSRQDRTRSKIVLLDEENRSYYYPVSSDSAGEVLPGFPQIVCIAFEPFREITGAVTLRISGARFTAQKYEPELEYRCVDDELRTDIAEQLTADPLEVRIQKDLAAQKQSAVELVQKNARGCLVMFGALAAIAAVFVSASWR